MVLAGIGMVMISRLGLGFINPSLNASSLKAVPPDKVRQGAGVANFMRQLGGAFGTNLLVAFFEVRTHFHAEALTATQDWGNFTSTRLLTLIEQLMSQAKGLPLQISNGGNNTNLGSPGQRPNNNGQSGLKTGPIADRLTAYFDPTVFSQAPIYTFGNTGRTSPNLRAPGVHGIDFSLFKDFRPVERLTLQFRAEAFNFTNSPTWNSPGTTVNTPGAFGVITAASGQRQVQLALKLSF